MFTQIEKICTARWCTGTGTKMDGYAWDSGLGSELQGWRPTLFCSLSGNFLVVGGGVSGPHRTSGVKYKEGKKNNQLKQLKYTSNDFFHHFVSFHFFLLLFNFSWFLYSFFSIYFLCLQEEPHCPFRTDMVRGQECAK